MEDKHRWIVLIDEGVGPIDRLFYSICLAKWRFDAAISGGSVSDDGRDCYRWQDSDTSQS